MSDAVDMVFAEKIAQKAKAQTEASEKKMVSNMLKLKFSLTNIAEVSEWPMNKLVRFAESMGYTAVAQ